MVMLGTPDSEDGADQVTEKAEDIGAAKISEHEGLSSKDAKSVIEQRTQLGADKMTELVDNWNYNGFIGSTLDVPARMLTLGFLKDRNTRRLSRELGRIAATEAEDQAKALQLSGREYAQYAKSTVNIMAFKAEACNRMSENIAKEISGLQERKALYNRSNNGLVRLSQLGRRGVGVVKTYFDNQHASGKLKRLEAMSKTLSGIHTETLAKVDLTAEKTTAIQQRDQDLQSTLASSGMNDEQVAMFRNILTQAVSNGTQVAIDSHINGLSGKGVLQSTDLATVKNLVHFLFNGNARAMLTSGEGRLGGFVAGKIGAITPVDIRNFYLKKGVDVARANQSKTLEERMEGLKNLQPGNEVQVGKFRLSVIRKDKEGVLVKEIGKNKMAYITTADKKKPVLTLKTGEKSFSKYQLTNPEKVENPLALAFDVADEKPAPAPKPAVADRTNEALNDAKS
jgi:hypothetical protein